MDVLTSFSALLNHLVFSILLSAFAFPNFIIICLAFPSLFRLNLSQFLYHSFFPFFSNSLLSFPSANFFHLFHPAFTSSNYAFVSSSPFFSSSFPLVPLFLLLILLFYNLHILPHPSFLQFPAGFYFFSSQLAPPSSFHHLLLLLLTSLHLPAFSPSFLPPSLSSCKLLPPAIIPSPPVIPSSSPYLSSYQVLLHSLPLPSTSFHPPCPFPNSDWAGDRREETTCEILALSN